MTINETKAVAAYFRNSRRFGRTTKLVCKTTGRVLFEGMGIATRKQLFSQFSQQA